ncbi:MAG: hypothetical protein B6242_07690 [Anaerolineaceae bacterium 4572_78]|nr:MAG: hypothetical protein B6242_07690 [Anaerolineaceae bacterium 4572_78]
MNTPQINIPETNVLIVDDTPANLRLLAEILADAGYIVHPITNARQALSAIQHELPDIVLLDVMMPEMNGYELCKQLKSNELTKNIPVIFISVLDRIFDKVNAFSIGGVDYITKPFHADEVLARVRTHLTIRDLQKKLESEIAELTTFNHTVAHDLKNPVSGIISILRVLIDEFLNMSDDEKLESLKVALEGGEKIFHIIDELLLLSGIHHQEIVMEPLNMKAIISEVQNRLHVMTNENGAEIMFPKKWPVAIGYAPWVEQIWVNYISNGLKYGGDPPRLLLGATPKSDGFTYFWVRDNGKGLTPEEQSYLFTEFSKLKRTRIEGHGLGLSIVQRIAQKLGGEAGVKSKKGEGSLFYFTLQTAEFES